VFAFLMRAPIDPDTVFIGSSPSLLAAQATAMAAAARGVRFVLEVRDLWPESLIAVHGRETLLSRALWPLADYLYCHANKIIVLAERSADEIAKRGVPRDKFVFIPNSVNAESEPLVPTTVGVPRDRFVAVYAGAHGPANDLETLVEAARVLRDRGDDRLHLVLVGDGTEKPKLMARARELRLSNLTFLAPIAKAEIPSLFARCHAGILVLRDLPLFRYGVSPNKLFDYMGAGLPVVTNVAGDCADIVEAAGCGIAVTPGDPTALADGLAQLAVDQFAPSRGAAGRRFVLQHFNRDRLVDRLVDVLRAPASR
jgi:glycosyltransferase involved in cell wall biosynthesis